MISSIVSSLVSHSFTSTSKIEFLSEGAIFFEMAAQYELSGNYKKALIWYFHSALRGHTESFNNIGVLRGSLVMSSATTLAEALWLQEHGADVVIAQGVEAGGHRGLFLSNDLNLQLPLSELLPACLEHLTIPIIAAGGLPISWQRYGYVAASCRD